MPEYAQDNRWRPLVNERVAEEFRRLGYVENRDFYVSPDLPEDYEFENSEDAYDNEELVWPEDDDAS